MKEFDIRQKKNNQFSDNNEDLSSTNWEKIKRGLAVFFGGAALLGVFAIAGSSDIELERIENTPDTSKVEMPEGIPYWIDEHGNEQLYQGPN